MAKPTFDVVVIATMSAGKSTVINALIGQELLHSANEATTATITRIHDKDDLTAFSATAYSYQNEKMKTVPEATSEILKDWNADPEIKMIDLVGNIQALHNDTTELVIYDTPGPNNSQDDNHEALTMEVINDGNYGLILYVLNATQLGVNDDRHLLETISKTLKADQHKEIIFLLNKADQLDTEKGERIEDVVEHCKNYLSNIGFTHPSILPISAYRALLVEKEMNYGGLTKKQDIDLQLALSLGNQSFVNASTLTQAEKEQILAPIQPLLGRKIMSKREHMTKAIVNSGFTMVHYLLQKKLTLPSNRPNKDVKRRCDILTSMITLTEKKLNKIKQPTAFNLNQMIANSGATIICNLLHQKLVFMKSNTQI